MMDWLAKISKSDHLENIRSRQLARAHPITTAQPAASHNTLPSMQSNHQLASAALGNNIMLSSNHYSRYHPSQYNNQPIDHHSSQRANQSLISHLTNKHYITVPIHHWPHVQSTIDIIVPTTKCRPFTNQSPTHTYQSIITAHVPTIITATNHYIIVLLTIIDGTALKEHHRTKSSLTLSCQYITDIIIQPIIDGTSLKEVCLCEGER